MEGAARDDRIAAQLRVSSLCHFGCWLVILAVGGTFVATRIDSAPAFYVQTFGLFAVMVVLISASLPRLHPHPRFGAANGVTLARAVIACLLAGLLGDSSGTMALGWLPAAAVLVALVFDGFDGWLARRFRTASVFGARFDLETDALTILILAILVFEQGKVGPWVLAIGGLRYLFLLAGTIIPRLSATLPESKRRQRICVAQYVALGLCLTPVVDATAAIGIAAAALALLVGSFLIDIDWLLRQRSANQHIREVIE